MTPTPRTLYVHDDLTELAAGAPDTARLARALLEAVGRDRDRVRVLSLQAQLAAVAAAGASHAPFALAAGLGAAGERVARALHARTGWFPVVRRVEVTREEDGAGYALSTRGAPPLAVQLAEAAAAPSVAVVDDTIFSGLTMRAVLQALPAAARGRTHAFCLRAVGESLGPLRALCPVTAGLVAEGRLLEDVSFINASGLVRRGAIRRAGRPPLAFYERPEWIRAWFPEDAPEIVARCAELARRLGPAAS
jgi:hypothetical protein